MAITRSQPFILGDQWGDHIFYWGQADTWLRLSSPMALSTETQQNLEAFRISYYYDADNGLSLQPPYVYRVFVPLLAGSLGHLVGLGTSFSVVHFVSLTVFLLAVGLSIHQLTRSTLWSSLGMFLSLAAIPMLTNLIRFPGLVEIPSLALTALAVYFTTRGTYAVALGVAVLASLTKETLTLLGLSIAIYAILREHKVRYWLVLVGLLPIALQLGMRILVTVPSPPSTAELFVPGNPFEAIFTFVAAFGLVSPLIVGLLTRYARLWILAFTPLFLSIAVVTTSVVAGGARIWLTVWPLIVIIGLAGLWHWARTIVVRAALVILLLTGTLLAQGEVLLGWPRILQTAWFLGFIVWLALLSAIRTWNSTSLEIGSPAGRYVDRNTPTWTESP